jgi:hypothetical protein
LDGGTFTTCLQALQCILACSGSDTGCSDACVEATQSPARGPAAVLQSCVAAQCANASGSALAACMQSQCAVSYAGCQQAECDATSRLVYVVDMTNRLFSFDPSNAASPFHEIGTLSCGSFAATPFSMSVDRTGRAWVLYTDGQIYFVNTATAACQSSGYQPSLTALQFGMGFAASTGGQERLYVSVDNTTPELEWIDPQSLRMSSVGALPVAEYSPELSGTATGSVFAYYPGQQTSFVARIDPASGHSLQQWNVPTLSGEPTGWAFAHWGGRFYIFVTDSSSGLQEDSKVLVLDPQSSQTSVMLDHLPYVIVGAGVSICAPIK